MIEGSCFISKIYHFQIERIQNPIMCRQYMEKKKYMDFVRIILLYHCFILLTLSPTLHIQNLFRNSVSLQFHINITDFIHVYLLNKLITFCLNIWIMIKITTMCSATSFWSLDIQHGVTDWWMWFQDNEFGQKNERLLWCGASHGSLDQIKTYGFDRNYKGKGQILC